jgi:hypothetical protein
VYHFQRELLSQLRRKSLLMKRAVYYGIGTALCVCGALLFVRERGRAPHASPSPPPTPIHDCFFSTHTKKEKKSKQRAFEYRCIGCASLSLSLQARARRPRRKARCAVDSVCRSAVGKA